MKDLQHETPVKTNPDIKVKRPRRRVYQATPAQQEGNSQAAEEATVVTDVLLQKETISFYNESSTNCSKKTERHHIPTELRADRIIDNAMAASMGLGLLPLPLLDSAGIMGIQLYMIRELSKTYQIEFSLIRSQAFVTSLIGGLGSVSIATGLFGSLVKIIPIIGEIAGALTLPVIAGATTYALGKLCIQSFSQGHQPPVSISQSTRTLFKEYFKKGIEAANSLHNRKAETNG